jgi:hypothetical protein
VSPPQLTPAQEALARDLAAALRASAGDLIDEIARTLAAAGDATLFGDTELKVRGLAHRIAARAYELRLRGEKTATAAPACPAPAAASPPPTTATARAPR